MASQFESLGVMPELISATSDMGWSLPSDVQDEAVPLILGGSDVMIAAETGSGKTGAFCLPIIQLIYEALHGIAEVPSTESMDLEGGGETSEEKNKILFSSKDRHSNFVTDGNICQARVADWCGGRCSFGVMLNFAEKERKIFYFEAKIQDEGLCRIGWSTRSSSLIIGSDKLSFGFGGTGKKSHDNQYIDYGESFGLNDVVGSYLDLNERTISFSKNGKHFGTAFTLNPSFNLQELIPAATLKNAQLAFNFGPDFLFNTNKDITPLSTVQPPTPSQQNNNNNNNTNNSNNDNNKNKTSTLQLPLALIIEPSKELAQQVYDEISKFTKNLKEPINHQCFVGGGKDPKEMRNLINKGIHILIGTTGVLMELVKKKQLDLSGVRYFVIDEADHFLDSKEDIFFLSSNLSSSRTTQCIICSATLHSPEISLLAEKLTENPVWVDLKGKDAVPESVDHAIIKIDPTVDLRWKNAKSLGYESDGMHHNMKISTDTDEGKSEAIKLLKPIILVDLIEGLNIDQAIIFVRMQTDADRLVSFLNSYGGQKSNMVKEKKETGKENKYSSLTLRGGLPTKERQNNLNLFKEGDIRFLICTEAGARGLDIDSLPYVINMTLPDKPEQYIHRVGRVGRGGQTGLAISLVGKFKEKVWFHVCKSKGKDGSCNNTALKSNGGCAIWHSEEEYLKDIEKRLHGVTIPQVDLNNIAASVKNLVDLANKNRKIGTNNADLITSMEHIATLQPNVVELSKLEDEVQLTYLQTKFVLKNKWSQMLKS